MPEFVMPLASRKEINEFAELDGFTQGYVEAMFFTECTPDNSELEDKTFADLAPDTLISIQTDCMDFQRIATELTLAYERAYEPVQAGRDFWFTRNGHGVGYWDRDVLEADGLGDTLSKRCRLTFSNHDLYLGDDGRLYLS